jgi:hypothetical protein
MSPATELFRHWILAEAAEATTTPTEQTKTAPPESTSTKESAA